MAHTRKELTPRERAILMLVAEGRRNRQIAEALGISEATVENHLHRIFSKLDVTNRTEAARQTRDAGEKKQKNEGNPS